MNKAVDGDSYEEVERSLNELYPGMIINVSIKEQPEVTGQVFQRASTEPCKNIHNCFLIRSAR